MKLVGNATAAEVAAALSKDRGPKDYEYSAQNGCILFRPAGKKTSLCFPNFHHDPLPDRISSKMFSQQPVVDNRKTVRGNKKSSKSTTSQPSKPFTVAIFREPKSRVISAFLDGAHHEGMDVTAYEILRANLSQSPGQSNSSILNRLRTYASHPYMIGCYTKMLLGHECVSGVLADSLANGQVDQAILEKALGVLRQLSFVGIFEQYDATLRLFHRMANSGTEPHFIERVKARAQRQEASTQYIKQYFQAVDPYDDVIYAEAKRIFNLSLAAYAVPP